MHGGRRESVRFMFPPPPEALSLAHVRGGDDGQQWQPRGGGAVRHAGGGDRRADATPQALRAQRAGLQAMVFFSLDTTTVHCRS